MKEKWPIFWYFYRACGLLQNQKAHVKPLSAGKKVGEKTFGNDYISIFNRVSAMVRNISKVIDSHNGKNAIYINKRVNGDKREKERR